MSGPRFDGGPSEPAYSNSVRETTQSTTRQPDGPFCVASRTYSPMCSSKRSTRLVRVQRKRLRGGLQPECLSGAVRRRLDPQSERRRKRIGLGVQQFYRFADAAGPLDAERGRVAEGDRNAVVRLEGRGDHLLLHLPVERQRELLALVVLPDVDERVLLGQLRQRQVERRLVPLLHRPNGGLERRRREIAPAGRARNPEGIADPHVAQAPDLRDLSRSDGLPLNDRRALESGQRRHLLVSESIPHANRPGEEPRVRDLVAGVVALDLEHGRGERAVLAPRLGGQQLRDTRHQLLKAEPAQCRARKGGMHDPASRLRCQRAAKLLLFHAAPLHVRGQELLVVLRERGQEVAVDRDDSRCQPLLDRGDHPLRIGPFAVDLVDEEERRHAQPFERAPEERRLRLHALHRRDDQHCAVQHREDALDLRDEVRVAGRVDQVDGDVPDRERRHRRLDGDSALLLQRERVGLRGALVHAAELVDHAGGMQQPLGERCLTGVYMRQDSQVERPSKQPAYLPIWSQRP